MIFAKLAFSNRLEKNADFRNILGAQNHWKSIKICMQKYYWNAAWIFIKIRWFSLILTSKMHLQNHQNIDFGSFLCRFGIDLMLQARILSDLGRPGSIFNIFRATFGFICEWVERGVCKQSPNEQNALISSLTYHCCCHLEFFSLPSGAAGCATRTKFRRLPTGVNGVLDSLPAWTVQLL